MLVSIWQGKIIVNDGRMTKTRLGIKQAANVILKHCCDVNKTLLMNLKGEPDAMLNLCSNHEHSKDIL